MTSIQILMFAAGKFFIYFSKEVVNLLVFMNISLAVSYQAFVKKVQIH